VYHEIAAAIRGVGLPRAAKDVGECRQRQTLGLLLERADTFDERRDGNLDCLMDQGRELECLYRERCAGAHDGDPGDPSGRSM
jgi:hypothetical protein